MSKFTSFESFEPVPDTYKKYRLLEDLTWEVGAKGSGWELNLPKGFEFDISVPRLFEWFLSPHDREVLLAAAVHDELLNRGHDLFFASGEFRRAAIARGKHWIFARILYQTTLTWTLLARMFGR